MESGYVKMITIRALVDHDEYGSHTGHIDHRDPSLVKMAWFEEAFRFHDIPYVIHPECGARCEGKAVHHSPWYYPGGEFVTEDGFRKIKTRLGRMVTAENSEVIPDNKAEY